jgi:transcriptional regulator with XRE-family HTH domain
MKAPAEIDPGRDAMVEVDREQLKEARRRKLLTQQQVADLSGLSRMTLQRLERGHTDALPSTLLALARVYGVSPRSLMRDGEPLESEVV